MIFVELLGRSSGVGYRIQYFYNLVDMKRVMAAALPFIALLLLFEFCALRPLQRGAFPWRPAEAKCRRASCSATSAPRSAPAAMRRGPSTPSTSPPTAAASAP